MMYIRMLAVAAGAGMALTLPADARAAAPTTTPADCARARAAADRAEKDYEEIKKDYLARIADGGNPDASQRQALADEDAERATARARAERICDRV